VDLEKAFDRVPREVINQSINQSIKVICNARNVVHKLESEARAVDSGRVIRWAVRK